ncbi:hypothetical protein CGCSCA4_v010974 [Colletotrichum siamense]|uniref:Uncharacterized protein n=1 Tax=Colletotrichum siamense TaxID=690259 RepID=A0A9P5K1C2_COLSI|nr:hypothetical protein CGCSCA5_v014640 [Colletotrichum siamense]KAF4839567.1 hypothetical protein CGCSCA4_v010974 [Colletotrichum siamense]KAF4853982.1 hypothetical protein CGCSCA2_v009791 [Colletotrichum siamense]
MPATPVEAKRRTRAIELQSCSVSKWLGSTSPGYKNYIIYHTIHGILLSEQLPTSHKYLRHTANRDHVSGMLGVLRQLL